MSTVIDIHSHILGEDWVPEEWWDRLVDFLIRENRVNGTIVDEQTVREEMIEPLFDPDGQKTVRRLRESGIEKRAAFTVDWAPASEEFTTGVSIEDQNRKIAQIADDHPDEIVPFASIDPRRDNATEFLETAFSDLDMQGLKLHPGSGFSPEDEETYDLFEICADYDVPVLLHTGPVPSILYSKPSHPMFLDQPLTDFPDVEFIAAHMGFGNWEELLAVGEWVTNMYVDICGWQGTDPDHFAHVLRRFIDTLGSDKVLFATDFPMEDGGLPEEQWIEQVEALTERTDGPTFTEREIEQLLGENAATLLD